MHRADVFFYCSAAFLVGVFIASLVTVSLLPLYLLFAGVVLIAVAGYQKTFGETQRGIRRRQFGLVIGVAALVAALGIFRFNYFEYGHSILATFAQHEVKHNGITVTLTGYLDSEETISASGKGEFVFHATTLTSIDRTIPVDESTLLILKTPGQYQFSDRISVTGPLALPQNFSDFDYVQYLKNKNISTMMTYPTITVDSGVTLSFWTKIRLSVYQSLFTVRHGFENALNRALPEPEAAYLAGVLFGGHENLPQTIVSDFNNTGTTHILAVSGYNITVIAEALLAVLVFFVPRRRAFWISVIGIGAFVIMTGASASVLRAAIMGILLLGATGFGKLYNARNAIMLAAVLMVLASPAVLVFDIGFQLSFLAVVGLITIYPILAKRTTNWPKLSGLTEVALMSCAAQIAVAPLLVYYFHQFSLVSLPANILVLPFMPLMMFLGFVAGLVGYLGPVFGHVLGFPAMILAAYQLNIIHYFGTLPFASLNVAIKPYTLAVAYAIVIFFVWKFRVDTQHPE